MNTAAGCAHTHFRAAFKQRSSQRLASFTLDLLTVALGIRPCFLNDYFHADIDALQSFLSDLQQAGAKYTNLRCLMISEESYFFNAKMIAEGHLLSKLNQPNALLFINASSDLPSPTLAGIEDTASLTSSFRLLHNLITSASPDLLVINTEWPRSPVIPSISGWLLDYPVVYVLGHNGDESNCLSNVPLTLFQVFGAVRADFREEWGMTVAAEHLVMSFSAPSHLMQESPELDFARLLRDRFDGRVSDVYDAVRVVESEVSLGCVVL